MTRRRFYCCVFLIAVIYGVDVVKLRSLFIDEVDLDTKGISESYASSHERFLVVEVAAGLTNQQVMLEEALFLAQLLNRTLILPRVRAHIPAGQALATTNPSFPTQPFDELFDREHFIQCADETVGVKVVIRENTSNFPPPQIWSNYIHRTWFQHPSEKNYIRLDWPSPTPWDVNPADVAHLFADDINTPVIRIVMPFLIFARVGGPMNRVRPCIRPSERLRTMVQDYLNSLPETFVCLHARTETDWFRECCQPTLSPGMTISKLKAFLLRESRFGLFPHQPDMWTCGNGERPAPTCYQTPQQIVETMSHYLNEKTAPSKGTHLWIASGSSDKALQPLFDQFHVHRANRTTTNNFMDYDIALVERQVCAAASQAWLLAGSSFSAVMQCMAPDVVFYNQVDAKRQHCEDYSAR